MTIDDDNRIHMLGPFYCTDARDVWSEPQSTYSGRNVRLLIYWEEVVYCHCIPTDLLDLQKRCEPFRLVVNFRLMEGHVLCNECRWLDEHKCWRVVLCGQELKIIE